ncbi:MAG: MarR family transcriptional regulator [Bacteroidota bacterium]
MKLEDAKDEFIESWGVLGSAWGINRTMSQILALLLTSPDNLSVEEIMEKLGISRGNASMNLRALADWNLIKKSIKKGDRKEYFYAEKDIWKLARIVAAERRKRELDLILKVLEKLEHEDLGQSEEAKEFKETMNNLSEVVGTTDTVLKTFINSDKNWLTKSVMKLINAKV